MRPTTPACAAMSRPNPALMHLGLHPSSEERAAMAEVLKYDVKASKALGKLVAFDLEADADRKAATAAAAVPTRRPFG